MGHFVNLLIVISVLYLLGSLSVIFIFQTEAVLALCFFGLLGVLIGAWIKFSHDTVKTFREDVSPDEDKFSTPSGDLQFDKDFAITQGIGIVLLLLAVVSFFYTSLSVLMGHEERLRLIGTSFVLGLLLLGIKWGSEIRASEGKAVRWISFFGLRYEQARSFGPEARAILYRSFFRETSTEGGSRRRPGRTIVELMSLSRLEIEEFGKSWLFTFQLKYSDALAACRILGIKNLTLLSWDYSDGLAEKHEPKYVISPEKVQPLEGGVPTLSSSLEKKIQVPLWVMAVALVPLFGLVLFWPLGTPKLFQATSTEAHGGGASEVTDISPDRTFENVKKGREVHLRAFYGTPEEKPTEEEIAEAVSLLATVTGKVPDADLNRIRGELLELLDRDDEAAQEFRNFYLRHRDRPSLLQETYREGDFKRLNTYLEEAASTGLSCEHRVLHALVKFKLGRTDRNVSRVLRQILVLI